MKLSKDQKRLIKLQTIIICIYIVLYPLAMLLAGRPMTWGQFALFAGISAVLYSLIAFLFVLGAKDPGKDD